MMMGTEIFKIDASWAEKLTKMRVSFLMTPTVYIVSVGTSRDYLDHSIYIKEDDLCDQVAEMAPVSHFNNLRNSSNVSRMQERSQL